MVFVAGAGPRPWNPVLFLSSSSGSEKWRSWCIHMGQKGVSRGQGTCPHLHALLHSHALSSSFPLPDVLLWTNPNAATEAQLKCHLLHEVPCASRQGQLNLPGEGRVTCLHYVSALQSASPRGLWLMEIRDLSGSLTLSPGLGRDKCSRQM